MKKGKAEGPSGVVAEMLKASGETGIEMITNLTNQIVREGVIPEDWDLSTIVNCYKGKGGALDRGCPEKMLYADDLALTCETMEGLLVKLKTWRKALESKGLRVNVTKTKVMISGCNVGYCV
ncbi:hypothetical protein Pmani_026888 [Petrolisthes manimaculis]|uniref:Reverse transcriptase domain-containing protein n=1 Tax=Petrolisthes manimaculis TaxID=1843537 RepID=A0AAE1TX05_9EUCA|nr:hypothetical protein Pmani_026888 [Petrolisthes manimaculis]